MLNKFFRAATGSLLVMSATAAAEPAPAPAYVEVMVVTASRWPETLDRIASTVQIIDEAEIRRSMARSATDLLAENAVGFFSEWTPAQTSVNLRGGASDGQGRDYRGQVLVLVNGRRAGTANLSKLSLQDVARMEVVRGPASVAYGSQAMGGVVNIITRSGANTEGGALEARAGSWNMLALHGYGAGNLGGSDFYLSLGGARQSDYQSGRNSAERPMENTAWQRGSALGAVGWDLDHGARVDLSLRRDGVFNAGFRGSSWDTDNYDDRYNQSLDLSYVNALEHAHLSLQAYAVEDVDDFVWGSGVAGVDIDHNTRKLRIMGLRSNMNLPLGDSRELLAGLDLEHSTLRNDRFQRRLDGTELEPAPMDNNHDEQVAGAHAELVQRLLTERLTLRAGVRYTYGETTSVATPGRADLVENTAYYDQITYSAGASFRLSDTLRMRAGFATGFRAPTATELAADFQQVLGGQVRGNANLNSETSQQLELGGSYQGTSLRLDAALFETRIADRIHTEVIDTLPEGNLSQFANNGGDIVLRGLDLQLNYDLLPGSESWRWSLFGNSTYHFHMHDEATDAEPQRVYRSQAGIGTRLGVDAWELNLSGILRGPMWYDTEEWLLIPEGEPDRAYVHRKESFWVWNLRSNYHLTENWRLFGGINNLFDKNEHPIFIALNREPFISNPDRSNGGRGNSMPGRQYVVGTSVAF